MRERIEKALGEAELLLSRFRSDLSQIAAAQEIAERIRTALHGGHKVLACGNGGSMADAMHFAEEWTGRFRADRKPYPVLALSDPTHITCVANDYGFDHVFSRQVEALGCPGDVLLVLSTSGNSRNLIHAAETARAKSMIVAGMLGRGGGELLPLCDVALMAPGETADRIQEIHMLCLHAIIEAVEAALESHL